MDLGDIMSGITGYEKLFAEFGFKEDGTGSRAWSHRYVDAHGTTVEFNAQGWELYKGGEQAAGRNHNDLKLALLQGCSKEELIKLLTAQ